MTRQYRTDSTKAAPDGRLFSPSFERNIAPISQALADITASYDGNMLEIGSGTGQHAAALARALPHLSITPSDPDQAHRASIFAWRDHDAASLNPPIALDASTNWSGVAAALNPLQVIFCANVIHISPFSVAQGIITGAAHVLAPGGLLIFYGPFMEDGVHTGDGNAAFDAQLRSRNPDWGIRDIADLTDLAAPLGFFLDQILKMPANNRMLVFKIEPT